MKEPAASLPTREPAGGLASFALLPGQGVNARNYGNQNDGCNKTTFQFQSVGSISKYSFEGVHLDLSYAACSRPRLVYR